MPSGSVIRIPTKSAATWFEVRRAILYRLSEKLGKSADEIAPGLIVEELLRIAMHHIYVEGYPSADEVKIKLDRQRDQLREMVDMAEMIEAQGKRIAALEGKSEAEGD